VAVRDEHASLTIEAHVLCPCTVYIQKIVCPSYSFSARPLQMAWCRRHVHLAYY
jgi:hypothetical protein